MSPKKPPSPSIRKVIHFFEDSHVNLYSFSDLSKILKKHKKEWGVLDGLSIRDSIAILLTETDLQKHEISFPSISITKYSWGDPVLLELALSLKHGSYLSHHTALYIHHLIKEAPENIYVNFEQKEKGYYYYDRELVQEDIDRAFLSAQRMSNNIASVGRHNICILNGKYTGKCGVIATDFGASPIKLQVTDIAVRPAYSGGVKQVLQAYKKATPRVSVEKVLRYLKQIDYIYPYHQVIGFYLEKTGSYDDLQIKLGEGRDALQ